MDVGKLILLVEDNQDDELLTLRAIKKNNILNDVKVSRTGEAAVEYLFEMAPGGTMPSIILLDLNLPKMSGLDVLRQIRSEDRTRLIPVVVLTSSKEDEDIINSYSLGANAYVRKPVDFAQFTQAVNALGLFWLLLNEVPKRPA
jgi:CheY-like chemotaxis protein